MDTSVDTSDAPEAIGGGGQGLCLGTRSVSSMSIAWVTAWSRDLTPLV